MGNASMKNPATLIVNADGTSRIEIDMQSLKYLGRDGYLGWLKKVTKVISENKYHYPTEIETEDAAVLEEYTGVYDVFNDPESTSADKVMSGRWYPKKLSISVENGEDDILVQVYVPVMESIMSGRKFRIQVSFWKIRLKSVLWHKAVQVITLMLSTTKRQRINHGLRNRDSRAIRLYQ